MADKGKWRGLIQLSNSLSRVTQGVWSRITQIIASMWFIDTDEQTKQERRRGKTRSCSDVENRFNTCHHALYIYHNESGEIIHHRFSSKSITKYILPTEYYSLSFLSLVRALPKHAALLCTLQRRRINSAANYVSIMPPKNHYWSSIGKHW